MKFSLSIVAIIFAAFLAAGCSFNALVVEKDDYPLTQVGKVSSRVLMGTTTLGWSEGRVCRWKDWRDYESYIARKIEAARAGKRELILLKYTEERKKVGLPTLTREEALALFGPPGEWAYLALYPRAPLYPDHWDMENRFFTTMDSWPGKPLPGF